MIAKLQTLDDQAVARRSVGISQEVIRSVDWNRIKRLSCYMAQKTLREVNPSHLIDYIRASHPEIIIEFVDPTPDAAVPTAQYDAIIVPVLAFDDTGNRLGRGVGWYDRFLAGQKSATKIGLAFSEQQLEILPTQDHDIRLDHIFSDKSAPDERAPGR